MTPAFSNNDLWSRAEAAINSWMGTPYRRMWMKKGRGADCSLFLGAVLQEVGIVDKVECPNYPPDWFYHTKFELIRTCFSANIASNMASGFSLVESAGVPPDLMRGDVVGFSMVKATGVTNHVGMLLDPPDSFIHSVQSRGVSVMHWGDYWAERVTFTYRVMEV